MCIVYHLQFHGKGYNLPQNKSVSTLLVVMYLWASHTFPDTSLLKEKPLHFYRQKCVVYQKKMVLDKRRKFMMCSSAKSNINISFFPHKTQTQRIYINTASHSAVVCHSSKSVVQSGGSGSQCQTENGDTGDVYQLHFVLEAGLRELIHPF